jgi:hypothetical protein
MAGLLMLLTGCHSGRRVQDSQLYERLSHIGHRHSGGGRDELAKGGAAAIVTQCEKASFANVRNGLIVGQTGLHEDIFEMRDPISLRTIAYGLNDTLQMEEMLRAEARLGGHSAEEAGCIQTFAENLESLTDPLVETDKLQKEIDLSAFSKAAKEAQDEKRRYPDDDKLPEISPPPPN